MSIEADDKFDRDIVEMERELERGLGPFSAGSIPHPNLSDPVNHPDYYTAGGIETIDFIQAKLTPEEFRGFCKGSILKYVSRAGKKGSALEDLQKKEWYLKKLISFIEGGVE